MRFHYMVFENLSLIKKFTNIFQLDDVVNVIIKPVILSIFIPVSHSPKRSRSFCGVEIESRIDCRSRIDYIASCSIKTQLGNIMQLQSSESFLCNSIYMIYKKYKI